LVCQVTYAWVLNTAVFGWVKVMLVSQPAEDNGQSPVVPDPIELMRKSGMLDN